MKLTTTLASFATACEVGGAIALPLDTKLGDHISLSRRDGCPGGSYLLYSNSAGPVCLGRVGVGIAISSIALSAGPVITYVKNSWNKPDCAQPPPASIPIPGTPASKLAKRDGVTGLNVQITKGIDDTTCTQRLSDDDWANSIVAISRYMEDEQDECVQAVVYEDDNGFEASIVAWVQTADGADHRSC